MLQEFFQEEKIDTYAALSIADAPIWDQEKFSRVEREMGKIQSVVVFLIPYNAGQKTTNLSVYAQVRDYHLYLRELSERLKKKISTPFRGFADSSPLSEREAALRAGLGLMGKNGLLIHPRYGSFCFIGAFFFAEKVMEERAVQSPEFCADCRRCIDACPTGAILDETRASCLSLISQKKHRTPEEEALLDRALCKWGCDLCQNVCPYNERAEETPIPFFREGHITHLTPEVAEMPKQEFLTRAFSWRGRQILRDNLKKKDG